MGKIVVILGLLILFLFAKESNIQDNKAFENSCLSCHKQQQIPSGLIYKRYLMKYSTHKNMKEAMFSYLKDPKKEYSIMPAPFFLKFPMKEKIPLDDRTLHKYIQMYLEQFDIKKKLVLEE
jgi:hypothetical protein